MCLGSGVIGLACRFPLHAYISTGEGQTINTIGTIFVVVPLAILIPVDNQSDPPCVKIPWM